MKTFKDFLLIQEKKEAYRNKERYKKLNIQRYGNGYLVYSNFCKAICKDKNEVIETFLDYGSDEDKQEIIKLVDKLMLNL